MVYQGLIHYLDDNNGLLYNIVHFCLNQVQQGTDTSFCCLFYFDGTAANCSDRLTDKVNINLSGISRMKGRVVIK